MIILLGMFLAVLTTAAVIYYFDVFWIFDENVVAVLLWASMCYVGSVFFYILLFILFGFINWRP